MKSTIKFFIELGLRVISLFSTNFSNSVSVKVYKIYSKSWSTGYDQYKKEYIESAITGTVPFLKGTYGKTLDERAIEVPLAVANLKGLKNVLDAGSALNHPEYLKHVDAQHIHIVTLFPEKYKNPGAISYAYSDLRNLPYRSNYFDGIACISTIEHIGFDNTQYLNNYQNTTELDNGDYTDAVVEMKRVLKQNGFLFITAPAGKATNLDKFQIFDQTGIDKMIKVFGTNTFELEFYEYKDKWILSDYDKIKEIGYRDNKAAAAGAIFTLKLFKE